MESHYNRTLYCNYGPCIPIKVDTLKEIGQITTNVEEVDNDFLLGC